MCLVRLKDEKIVRFNGGYNSFTVRMFANRILVVLCGDVCIGKKCFTRNPGCTREEELIEANQNL